MAITLMRAGGAALLSMALPTAAQATPATEASVEQALASNDYRRASIEFNKLAEQRLPPNDTSGPDPVLDRFLVRLISVGGPAPTGVPLLRRITADAKLQNRGYYQLLLGTALEESGELAEAERVYDALRGAPGTSPDDRTSAAIGFARLRMMTSPDEALAALQTLQPAAAQAWEVDLQRARAAALAGREDAARAALERAWAAAPMAEAGQSAAARSASDMMLAAGRAGDRARMIALLSVDRLNRSANTGQDIVTGNLPVCGSAGIGPDDSVAIEFLRQPPPGRPRFSLAWANRPGVAATFLAAVARNPGYRVSDGHAAAVILKCRVAPAEDYKPNASLDDQILSWSTSRGAYPLIPTGDEADPSALASTLADRERRYGPTSPMLVPVLIAIQQPMMFGGQETLTRSADLLRRIGAIVAANRGPADMVLLTNISATALEVSAQTKSATAAQAEFKTLLDAAARAPDISLDTLFTVVSGTNVLSQAPDA